jgi:signal transduction histidine kinase
MTEHDTDCCLIGSAQLRSVLSNLSHELCRPLLSLRAGFELLLTDSSATMAVEQRGHVQTMALLCDDLLRLTRSYLDYAGLVQGVRPLCFGEFTVGALVGEIDRQFAPIADSRRIQWVCTADGREATVTTDASRFQQVLGNLAENALKYTPPGGSVHVSVSADQREWVVTVADDGPGIPAEHAERVFEPFYRLARDEQSRSCGNGLGLAICRELVGQLSGTIKLHSAPGRGATFTARFPVAPPPKPAAPGR